MTNYNICWTLGCANHMAVEGQGYMAVDCSLESNCKDQDQERSVIASQHQWEQVVFLCDVIGHFGGREL